MTPQTAAVWTMSTAPAAISGRYCSSPVRFSPVATDARMPRPTAARPSASQRRTGSSIQMRSRVRSSSQTCRTACLRVHASFDVEHQARPPAVPGLGQHVPDQAQPVPVPLDVEAALELGRPQAVARRRPGTPRRVRRRSGRCPGRTRRRGPAGRVRPAAATAVRRRPCALMSHSAVSSAPMVPKTAPAWPALKVCRSMRSYRAVTRARVLALDGGEDRARSRRAARGRRR